MNQHLINNHNPEFNSTVITKSNGVYKGNSYKYFSKTLFSSCVCFNN